MNKPKFPPMPPDPLDEARKYRDLAIATGVLSNDSKQRNYYGRFLYKGVKDGKAQFKDDYSDTWLFQDIHEQV